MLNKKTKFISILAMAFVATSAFAVGNLVETKAAAPDGSVFEMEAGASLKISEDGGVRFRVKMDEAQKNYITENDSVSLNFLVAPHEFFNAVPGTDGTRDYYGGLSKKKNITVDEAKIYEEDGSYWANGCITNILEANRYLDFTLLAYTYNASTQTYDYADATIATTRASLVDVLSQAVVYSDDEGTDYMADVFACGAYDWFGTADYPIQVNNLATYNNLVRKVNDGVDFSAYTINVSDTVPADGRVDLAEGKTLNTQDSCIVKFCNADGTLYKKYIVANGATIAEPKAPASASEQYAFAGWDMDGDGEVDEVAVTVEESVTYTAVYEKQYEVMPDGVQKIPGSNGEIYRHAFVGLSTDLAVGTPVTVTMDVYVTGILGSPTAIKWVDTVWTTSGGEVNSAPTILDYATMTANEGQWISVEFEATVRSFGVLRLGTEYDKVDTSAYGNAVYVLAANFMSAVSFNYKNVQMTEIKATPDGTQKTTNANGYYQAFTGLSTDLAAGTKVAVSMDIKITGTNDQYGGSIYWVDTVYSVAGGEVDAEIKILDARELTADQVGQWVHVEFEATVRDFDVLRMNSAYPILDTSAYGNAVFLMAENFKSAASFNYKNVEMKKIEIGVMPDGTQKTANPNNYYQSFTGLSTDLAVGTKVAVSMDVYVTGTYDQYSGGIKWVDTLWSTSGGEVNEAPTIVTIATMDAYKGQWITVEFEATVRNFAVLRTGVEYATQDMSAFGNAVYLFAKGFKSVASFNYKNVVITAL